MGRRLLVPPGCLERAHDRHALDLLQRHFQDIHVISQHMQSRMAVYELVGRYWLGLPIDDQRL